MWDAYAVIGILFLICIAVGILVAIALFVAEVFDIRKKVWEHTVDLRHCARGEWVGNLQKKVNALEEEVKRLSK